MDKEPHWYALHTFNGYEAVAENNLKKLITKYNLQERIFEIYVPKENKIVERKDKNGNVIKKAIVEERSMPTYLFVKMIYGDDIWHTITRTRGITGFVGPKGRPLPLSEKDVKNLKLERKLNPNIKIAKDDVVEILTGMLTGQTAKVVSVDETARTISVNVVMFGRNNKIEIGLDDVRLI
jgi:transcriptional antiterminator NusG